MSAQSPTPTTAQLARSLNVLDFILPGLQIHIQTSIWILLITMGVLMTLALSFLPTARAASSTHLTTGSGGSLIVNANTMFRDSERQIIELTGNVQAVYEGQYLSCDRAIIHLKTQEIEAIGKVVISSPTAYVEGDSAMMSYKDNTGVIVNGFVKSGQVIFEGRVVRKTGPQNYEAETASYTACTTCPAAWSFTGTRIRAEMGGYAHIRNSVLEVGNVPVFWLPYLIVPLKSERQTGLLIPTLDMSDFGKTGLIGVSQSFFWAISRSQDATFSARFYPTRGIKGLINYRYMLTETSLGEMNMGLIRDRLFPQEPYFLTQPLGTKDYRWFLTYAHNQDLPGGWSQKTNLVYVSDLRYSRDFPDELGGRGDPALDNRITLTKNTESTHTSADASYYFNQLKSNPIATNEDAVHRWPELRYSIVERSVGGSNLLFNFSADYVNFAREDLAFDDVIANASGGRSDVDLKRGGTTPGSGVYNPELDVIRAGQRLDLQPEVSYPFRIGPFIDALPSLQFRHTHYSFNVTPPAGSSFDPMPYRQYLRGQLSFRTRFGRVYGRRQENASTPVQAQPFSPQARGWVDLESLPAPTLPDPATIRQPDLYRHEIEPNLILTAVPYLRQSDNPFFGDNSNLPIFLDTEPIKDSDFLSNRGIQFDYYDRITNRNTMTFALNNSLVRKSGSVSAPNYLRIVNLRLAQSYDFDEARRTDRQTFPWSDISALLDVRLDNFETNTLVKYFPYHNVTNTSTRVKIMNGYGDFLQATISQSYQPTLNTNNPLLPTESVSLAAGFDSQYLLFSGQIDLLPEDWKNARFKVSAWSSDLTFKPPGKCWGIRTSVSQIILKPEVLWKFWFDFRFGGGDEPTGKSLSFF